MYNITHLITTNTITIQRISILISFTVESVYNDIEGI